MKEITLKAPATIANFGPGFDIFALALEEPYDIIRMRLTDSKSIKIKIKITGRAEGLPTSAEDNTAGQAAFRFFERTNRAAGLEIEINKRMKSCSGLGSSGASAVACVYGLNRLLNANIGQTEMIDIARLAETVTGGAAHADNVAGCLLGGFVLIKDYSPLSIEKMEIPDIPLVICAMKKPQLTTRGLISPKIDLGDAVDQMARCASLVLALANGNLKRIGEAVNRDHLSEPVRSKVIPGYEEIKSKVLETGAYGCNVSGGGSSVFAVCEEEERAAVAGVFEDFSRKGRLGSEIILTRASNSGIVEIDGL